jgi:hypothetical protein
MTWYEKHFGFEIAEEYRKEHEAAKEIRKSISFIEPYDYSIHEEDECIKMLGICHFFRCSWEKNLE